MSQRRRPRRWFKVEVEKGRYAQIPAWNSREQYLRAIEVTVESAAWRADRAASFAAVAEMLADVADAATGRSVTLSVRTIERRLGLSRSTVFRRLRDMYDHGLIYRVDRGEHLPGTVREEIRQKTGRFVTGKTSTRALSIPSRMAPLVSDTPPNPVGVGPSAHLSLTHQTRKRAEKTISSSSTTEATPRPIALQRLAAKIDRQIPSLLNGAHPGALADALVKAGADESWTTRDVVDSIDAWHAAGSRTNAGRTATNPIGWLVWSLRNAIAGGAKPRTERLVDEATARARRHAQRVAEQEQAERERVAPEKAASILAGARAALAARQAARAAEIEAERARIGTLEARVAALAGR